MSSYRVYIEVEDNTSLSKIEEVVDKALNDAQIECTYEVGVATEVDEEWKVSPELALKKKKLADEIMNIILKL